MYKIRGGDGNEYGPVTADALRQWIAERRANAETLVQREGTTMWQVLGSLPEFADVFGAAGAAAGTGGGPGLTPGVGADQGAQGLAKPAGWALTVVGILGILWNLGQGVFYAVGGTATNPMFQNFLQRNPSSSGAMKAGFIFGLVFALVFGVVWAGFVAYAGTKLRRLESWGLVLTAAILCLMPCFGSSLPVCFLSFPVGVWVIIVLCQPKVKNAFT